MGRLNAGQLRERVTLLTPAAGVPDGCGGFVPGGADTTTVVFARVVAITGAQLLALGQVLNNQAYAVTVRALPGSRAGQRLTWKGLTLRVQAVNADEAREYLTLTCYDSGK